MRPPVRIEVFTHLYLATPIPRLHIPSIRMSDGPNVCCIQLSETGLTEFLGCQRILAFRRLSSAMLARTDIFRRITLRLMSPIV